MPVHWADKRSGKDRRSNWQDALERLYALDFLLKEIDSILSDLRNAGKAHSIEMQQFDNDELYWADRIESTLKNYKDKQAKNG